MINISELLKYKQVYQQRNSPINREGLRLISPIPSDVVQLSKTDFLQLPRMVVFEKIKESMKNVQNMLGEGGEAFVSLIDDTGYCVRVVKDNTKKLFSEFSKNITEDDRINHVVAKLGGGSSIMRNIEGYPVMLPPMSKLKVSQKEIDKMIEEMPVSAFHKIFKQVCHAKDNDMIFDCNWTNVIVNPKNKTLTAIDFYKMDPEYPEIVKPLRNIYASLVHGTTKPEQKKKCAGNLLLGVMEELKPKQKPCLELQEFGFSDFINRLFIEKTIQESPHTDLLRGAFADIQTLKFKELIGEDIKNELEGKLKVAKCLVNQIFLKSS